MFNKTIFIMIILILAVIPFGIACLSEGDDGDVESMEKFLMVSYDEEIGLFRESPTVAPNVFWVASDGYLATLALDDESLPNLAVNSLLNQYGLVVPGKWRTLTGESIPEVEILTPLESGVLYEIDGQRIMFDSLGDGYFEDYEDYADLLFYLAINAVNSGNQDRARSFIDMASQLWDGAGFADRAYPKTGTYETYKLALYLIASEGADYSPLEHDLVIEILRGLIDSETGGVYTHYNETLEPALGVDMNVETTSLTILALREK